MFRLQDELKKNKRNHEDLQDEIDWLKNKLKKVQDNAENEIDDIKRKYKN